MGGSLADGVATDAVEEAADAAGAGSEADADAAADVAPARRRSAGAALSTEAGGRADAPSMALKRFADDARRRFK